MKVSQCDQVLAWMFMYGHITQKDAYTFGCTRLAARISDLRRTGKKIVAKMVKVPTADGGHAWVSSYSLAKEGEE